MKKTALLLAPFLLIMGLSANSNKVEETVIDKVSVETGTTKGHYQKPGAPINMSYKSTKVDRNETSDINITLSTTARKGTMSIMLTFDDNLTEVNGVEHNISFEINPEQKSYPINLQVKSLQDGLYYIRLLTKIDKGSGLKLRSFAIPVYVGEKPQTKTRGMNLLKANSGENISVSKAVETIQILDEK